MTSLTVERSLLYPDITDILATHTDKYVSSFNTIVKLHTEEKDLDYTDLINIAGINVLRDYVTNITDYIEIKLTIPLGLFIYEVYPYLDNIEVTLITQKQLYKGKNPVTISERYKAVYLIDKNTAIPTNTSISKFDLDQQLPAVIVLQLIDRSAETIRIKTTQGNFHNRVNISNKDMSPKAFLKSILSEETNKILIENNPPLDSIQIEEPDNKEQLKSIVIPSYTRLIELPEHIQNKSIGIYNAGIGCYIQRFGKNYHTVNKTFFVYSLYDPKKYKTSEYKVIFYSPVTSSYSITDITYKYKDKVLKILPHSINKIRDAKETLVMSTGSGFRISNANSYMKKPIDMKPDGPSFNRNRLSTEVVYKERKDGLNFSPNKSVTGNSFALTSEVLAKQGSYVTTTITNIDIDLIQPGSACLINYENKENTVEELYGVIHQLIVTYTPISGSIVTNRQQELVQLTAQATVNIFVVPGLSL